LAEGLRRELSDPRVASVVITNVELADDLTVAKIGVRLLVGDDDPAARRSVLESLRRAGGRLRSYVAPKLDLRRAPELRFSYDSGHDASKRVEELLREIDSEPKAKE
jgi:ribosome-binding factor A